MLKMRPKQFGLPSFGGQKSRITAHALARQACTLRRAGDGAFETCFRIVKSVDLAATVRLKNSKENMDYVKHPTLPPELLHGQTMLERKPASHAPRQRGRLFVSEKRPEGSFVLKFRLEITGAEPDQHSEQIGPPDGRLLCQNEVDRIRANTNGERQLTGCAFTLDPVGVKLSGRVSGATRSSRERSSFRDRPPRR